MPLLSRWPHRPTKLSDLIDPDTLSVLISGSCARLGRALTVLDYDRGADLFNRIDPLQEWQNHEPFCRLLRDDQRVRGGNAACEACDQRRARQVLRTWANDDCHKNSAYRCHMGMVDYSQVICVKGIPVGVLFAGQFVPNAGVDSVQRAVKAIADGTSLDIEFLDGEIAKELLTSTVSAPRPPVDFSERFRREADHIQMVAEAYYASQKADTERKFLDALRNLRRYHDQPDLTTISDETQRLLRSILQYCHCKYIVLFTNISERDTVLSPLAQVGFDEPSKMHGYRLPHFNWTKAGLPSQNEHEWRTLVRRNEYVMNRGIRGEHSTRVADSACAIATILGGSYRGIALFGPFEEVVDPSDEQDFLFEVSRIVGWYVYSQIQTLRLYNEKERLTATAQLLQHRFRTALTPITTHVGRAKLQLDRRQYDAALRPVTEHIKAAKELCLQVGKSAGETARSAVVMVEHDDLKFDIYPLSVLVANCAEGFVLRAMERGRELTIEQTIESLPYAEVDIARLTIAVSNLLDNAVKYSYPSTRILVRAVLPSAVDQHHATFSIQNLGDPIPTDKMEKIFERGERGLVEAKMGKIEGTGYGLWEARAIVEAHRGAITVSSEETGYHSRQGRAYRITFSIRLPLRQNVGT